MRLCRCPNLGAVRAGLRFRVTVLVGIAVAATVLASATGARSSSPVTPADTSNEITAIRSGLEPAAFLARVQPGIRFSAKHRDGDGSEQVAVTALATVGTLALGQAAVATQRRSALRRQVHHAWAQRAPPSFQHA